MTGAAMRLLLRLAAALRDLAGIALTLLAAALAFLLFTQAGARLALRGAETYTGLVHAEDIEGRLWGPLRFGRFIYEDGTVRVELEQVRLDWSPLQALMRRIAVSQLRAEALTVAVKSVAPDASSPTTDSGAVTQLPVGLDIRDLVIDRFDLRVDGVEPMQFERIQLAGSWIGDAVRLAPLAAVTPWVGAVRVEGEAQLLPDAVRIARLDVADFARATLQGRLGYGTDSDLLLRWSALQWPPGEPAQLRSDGGELRWQGRFDEWRYQLSGTVETAGERLRLAADGRGSLEGLEAERAHVDSGHGVADGTATLRWTPKLTIDADARLSAVRPQHWLPQVTGELNGRAQVASDFAGSAPDVRFTLALERSRLNGYPLQLDAQGRYADGVLDVGRLDLRSGPSHVHGSGTLWPELATDLRLDSRELASLWPPLRGRARASVRADGPWATPRLSGRIEADALRYGDYAAESASSSFDVDAAGALRVDAQLRKVDVATRISSAQLNLRGRTQAHRLTLDLALPQGNASVTLDGAWDRAVSAWAGTLTAAHLAPRELPVWDLDAAAALRVAGADVTLEPACFASDVARACAALRPLDAQTRRAAFRLERFRLAALDPWLPGGVSAEGQVDGSGYVDLGDGGLRDLQLELHSGVARLARRGLPPLELRPAHVLVQDRERTLVVEADVPFAQGGLRLDAQLAPGADFMQRALSGEVRARLPDLSWIPVLNHEFTRMQGRIDGRVALGGTPSVPEFDGQLTLSDGGVRLRTPGIELARVEATVSGAARSALALQAHAFSDSGRLDIDGRFDPWQQDEAMSLRVRGTDFQALRTPDARVWVSPALDVTFAGAELHVDGSIDVPRADITPESVDTGVGPSPDQVIVRRGARAEEPPAISVFADVQLRLGDAVRFDGFGLKSKLGGAVRLVEAPGVPTRARGEVQLLEGRYKAYGQELSIETGRLLFTGGALTSPAVELRATRKPRRDITVGVVVRGTLDAPEFSLFSTPAMPQERQLSWLVLGRAIDESTGTASDRALVADAALSMGFAGSEWLAERFSGKLGLDEISIGSQPGESSDQAAFTIGKYLSPRIFISYGVSLFQPGHTFRMQYDIGGGFKLATEAGAESGGDLLYTFEK